MNRALLLTSRGSVHPVTLGDDIRTDIAGHLSARWLEVQHVIHGIDMWRDLEEVTRNRPVMNIPAMSLLLCLRGPIHSRVIFGDVLFTDHCQDPLAPHTGLSPHGFTLLRQGLESVLRDHRTDTRDRSQDDHNPGRDRPGDTGSVPSPSIC